VASADRCTADNPPQCDDERHSWRVYNGRTDATTVTFATPVVTQPPVTNDQFTLSGRGDYFEFSVDHGVSFVLEADGVIMPVQYLQSRWKPDEPLTETTDIGDPAMVQMVPVDEWLSRYVFVTGVGFHFNYVQIVQEATGADVQLDNILITSYTPVGDFRVATMEITEGAHVIESDSPFGIIQMGYSDNVSLDCIDMQGAPILCGSSYAYPGGMKSVEIYIP
jgi:hypothetical protein